MEEWMLNDLLECSVCLERLDTSSKVLPCQHTFCKKCLEEIRQTQKELRCPECRTLVGVEIDELPPNVLLMRILEGMKNAPRRVPSATRAPPDSLAYANVYGARAATSSRGRSKSATRQVSHAPELHQPYAIASYDCVATEPGDLTFKKGDIIYLRRKIDQNWYQGECNGVLGVFPLPYVQVIIPLPSHIPQCKALYEFSKCHEDDEGCLHFSKGDIITVLRRIDENWAEGKLDDRIGIFPITFVEMNNLARNLMKLSTNSSAGPSRDAPPTPTTEEAVPLIPSEHATVSSNIVQPTDTVLSPSSSSSTTTTTSPTTSSDSSDSTTPSSPASPTTAARSKRHSYTLGTQPPPYQAPPAVHRHSVEISKQEDGKSPKDNPRREGTLPAQPPVALSDETPRRRKRAPVAPRDDFHLDSRSTSSPGKQNNGWNLQRQSSLRIPRNNNIPSKMLNPPPLPASYIALYPYKPQKTDELELRIGSIYTVVERCQDGWFKGTSYPSQDCGVFPGNYVTPVKSLTLLQAQLKGIVQNVSKSTVNTTKTTSSSTKTSTTVSPPTTVTTNNGSTHEHLSAPALPARALSPASSKTDPTSSNASWQHTRATNTGSQETTITSSSVSAKHSSRTVTTEISAEAGTSTNSTASQIVKVIDKAPKLGEKPKEKKEKCGGVSLMRRLTSMKKSKSPPPMVSGSMENPAFDDGSAGRAAISHARSDSCPSKLTYSSAHASNTNHASIAGGSQRIKYRQRPCVQGNAQRSTESSSSSKLDKPIVAHKKSSSLDATAFEERLKAKQILTARERYQCIAPYPPNSEFELELKVGDIISVHKKREDGWFKGTLHRNGKTGLFPASFVEIFD